ncbi:MAG: transposase [Verrucomicrobiota bacterium]
MGKGIYNRGYLPHWDIADAVQAVTFRLADSVPNSVIQSWMAELFSIGDDQARQKQLHLRIARYEDAGHGSSVLKQSECAAIVQAKLIAGHPIRYRLIDWCVMPNHVHVLCKTNDALSLGEIIQAWKGGSSVEINRLVQRSGRLWQREYYDRFIRDLDHFYDCRAYIRNNPVKAGLCSRPEDWPFSAAGIRWNP